MARKCVHHAERAGAHADGGCASCAGRVWVGWPCWFASAGKVGGPYRGVCASLTMRHRLSSSVSLLTDFLRREIGGRAPPPPLSLLMAALRSSNNTGGSPSSPLLSLLEDFRRSAMGLCREERSRVADTGGRVAKGKSVCGIRTCKLPEEGQGLEQGQGRMVAQAVVQRGCSQW